MASIKEQIQEDMKAAMRAKDKDRLSAIRLILAEIKQKEVDERIEVDDTHVLAILDKMSKQRRESISQFESAGRDDLVAQENGELAVIQSYLPEALTEAELDELIQTAVTELNATSMQDMGKVMAQLKPQIQGRADGGLVSQKVKAKLTS